MALLACASQAVVAGVRIIGPDQVLAQYTRMEGGRLYLTVPGITPQELVTSTDDPAIANPGDGSFHPFDPEAVAAAIASMSFPVDQVDAVVFVLPYPRRAGLESAAAPGAILLSPGTRPVDLSTVHGVVAHELGHVVQYALAPEGSSAWTQYARLRGIPASAGTLDEDGLTLAHADRPRELFAEDFRTLMGSTLARGDGAIERATAESPTAVAGLADYFIDLPARAQRTALAGAAARGHAVAAYPNPFRSSVQLALPSTPKPGERTFMVVDARGRMVRRESVPATGDGSASWRWDGTADNGVRLAPGTYFVTAEGEQGRATRIVLTR